ncbi:MAG: phosphatidate cytidylyltransferase [Anaerolineae bacterium]
MLVTRIISAAILIPVVGIAIYLGGPTIFAVGLLAALLAAWEYLDLVQRQGVAASRVLTLGTIVLLFVDAQWPQLGLLPLIFAAAPLVVLSREVFTRNTPGALSRWTYALAGSVYIGYSLSYLLKLRAVEGGALWLAVALLGTWICDTGAYLVGCHMGKHRFFPEISPRKTVEGALGGLAFGVVSVVLLSYWLVGLPVFWGVCLGILLVFAATIGDLAESVIKRQVGVKDSGHLIPGHGGMLDRVDSLLFVIPMVYYFATFGQSLLR